MADDAILKFDVDLHVGIADAPRRFVEERLDTRHIATIIAHHIDRMGMERTGMEPGGGLVGVADPHGHVDQQQVAQLAFRHPLFRLGCRRHKAVVEVDAIVDALLIGLAHHLARLFDLVGDGLFSQHMFARLQTLHGRLIMVAAIFFAGATNAHGVDLFVFEQILDAVIGFDAITGRRLVGTFLDNVANRDQFDSGVGLIDGGMGVANPTQTDYCNF